MNKIALYAVVALALSTAPFAITPAAAKQYRTADGKVAHTRLAPVVVHRISPPFKGQHVYGR
jgi:hypothetical protein